MRVLVACEFSGIVRTAFRNRGHDAWSCDLLPSESGNSFHYQTDVRVPLVPGAWDWDLLIAFPPCTALASSGARWFEHKTETQRKAVDFVRMLAAQQIYKIAIENPIGVLSTVWRKPDQIIQPWQFGHGETKSTCFWLKNLPLLVPTDIVTGRSGRVWHESPSADRWKRRSRTLKGIAEAMADQWGETEYGRRQYTCKAG